MIKKVYLKTKPVCKVTFSFSVENATTTAVLGLNGDWDNAIALTPKKGGIFSAEIALPKDSTHEFKYLVNETDWYNDPEADGQNDNDFGGTNSVINL